MRSKTVFFIHNRQAYLEELELPPPRHNEVQAKTLYNGICMAEVWKYTGQHYDAPFLPGHEGVGIVTDVGDEVEGVTVGDYITTRVWSEYTNQPAGSFIRLASQIPPGKSHLVEPASCVVTALNAMHIYPGDSVILFGAGYMGLLLVQLLARYPLSRLVVADIREESLALARAFGAGETINTATAEGQARLAGLESDRPFEAAYECSGAAEALAWCERLLIRGGKLGVYGWHHGTRQTDGHLWHTRGLSILNVAPGIAARQKDMVAYEAADRLMTAGVIDQTGLVTHKYALEDIERAMEESVARSPGFIKSVLVF